MLCSLIQKEFYNMHCTSAFLSLKPHGHWQLGNNQSLDLFRCSSFTFLIFYQSENFSCMIFAFLNTAIIIFCLTYSLNIPHNLNLLFSLLKAQCQSILYVLVTFYNTAMHAEVVKRR